MEPRPASAHNRAEISKGPRARVKTAKATQLNNNRTAGKTSGGRRKKKKQKVIPSTRENKTKTKILYYIYVRYFSFSSFLATEKKKKPEVPNGWRCCDETQVTHDDGHRVDGAAQEENSSRGAQTRALAIYCLRCLLEMSVAFSLVGPGPGPRTAHIPYNPSAADVALCRMSRGVPCAIAHQFYSLLYYTAGPFTLPPTTTSPPSTTTTTTTIRSICRRCGIGYPRLFFPFFSRWKKRERERDVNMYWCSVLLFFDQFNPAHL